MQIFFFMLSFFGLLALGLAAPLDVDSSFNPATTLVPRDAGLCCPVTGQDWGPIRLVGIQQGISDLFRTNLIYTNGDHCVRLTCNDGGAIWLCNQESKGLWIQGPTVAKKVEGLLNGCGDSLRGTACGQLFWQDPAGFHFNIVVRADSC